jgi:DNA-binding response OmpR family regulator
MSQVTGVLTLFLIRIATMSSAENLKIRVIIYSDDLAVRAGIVSALGRKMAADLPAHEVIEFATAAALRAFVDRPDLQGDLRADLFILDGEAVPEGGMSVARQLKDEVFNCPPVLLITGRKEDAWLAAWSRADATVIHPIDPFTLAQTAANLLRKQNLATTNV